MIDFSSSPLTYSLILANIVISFYALGTPAFFERWSFKPYRMARQGEWDRFVSSGFLHGGIAHVAFNLITLFFFGRLLEQVFVYLSGNWLIGAGKFLALYFGSMLVAHGYAYLRHRDDPEYVAVGASGAISGIIFSFCLFFPFEKLYLFFVIGVPAYLFAIGFIAFSIYALRKDHEGVMGMVAHDAHLGGAIGGLVLTLVMQPNAWNIFLRELSEGIQGIFNFLPGF